MINLKNFPLPALVAFVPINDKAKALAFYRDQLGPSLITFIADESPFALVFKAGEGAQGTTLRATFAGDFTPQPFTILGWRVADIAATATDLAARGVPFTRYPGMNDQHPLAIWTAPGGTQVAWFTDPFGNTLSLQQDIV